MGNIPKLHSMFAKISKLKNISMIDIMNQMAFVQIFIIYVYNSQIGEKFEKLLLMTSFSNVTTCIFQSRNRSFAWP